MDPLAIALEGVLSSPLLLALRGLLPTDEEPDPDGGRYYVWCEDE